MAKAAASIPAQLTHSHNIKAKPNKVLTLYKSGPFLCAKYELNISLCNIIHKEVFFLKIHWKRLLLFIAIPLAVGGLSALLTMGSMEAFGSVTKPPLSPPSWLFPVVWTILFVLMGIASYLVWQKGSGNERRNALTLYFVQLFFNFCWSIIFFSLEAYLFAFIWLLVLWGLIIATTVAFYRIDKRAGYLMLPYLLWVTFAGYLNLAIYILNT